MLQERFLRLPDVVRHVGFKDSKIYALIQVKQFPAPIKLGRTSVWLETEIAAWMTERIDSARLCPLPRKASCRNTRAIASRLA
ncbi:helix-turn-helix transcriptional regulator [Novosphingobium sp.]|uniref:helix-turn-helix transcriptional regulator n=1 Tax=Novosphingobium sp. TaxID=1874826 RepID=UPI003B52C634